MRCNRKVLLGLPLFLVSLVLLRQGILAVAGELPVLEQQFRVMQQQDIDPAALFYTDSRVALRAIHQARQRVNPD